MKISGTTAARVNPSENDKFRFNVRATHANVTARYCVGVGHPNVIE